MESHYDPDIHVYAPHNYPINFQVLLNQINRVRIALAIGEGLLPELPPGKMSDPQECVIARALSNGWHAEVERRSIILTHASMGMEEFAKAARALRKVGFKGVRAETDHVSFEPTVTMRNFITRYDDGQFPQLMLEAK